jgi:MHS family proline/betaine transporter-like MFS transporter
LELILGPIGLFIRRHLQETDAFLETSGGASGRPNFDTTLVKHVKQVLVCMGVVTSGTISFYVILLYMPTFARVELHLPLDQAFVAHAISLTCMIVTTRFPAYCLAPLVAS